MKRKINLIMICIVVIIMLTACHEKGDSNASPDSAEFLPKRVEEINNGGSVPKGSESKNKIEKSSYDISSFWGTWVLKGSGTSDVHITDKTMDYTVTTDSGENITLPAEYFPKVLSFHPANIPSTLFLYGVRQDAENDQLSFGGQVSNTSYSEVVESVPIEEAFENLGYGVGSAQLQGTKGYNDIELNFTVYGERAMAYAVSGDILALGLLDADSNSLASGMESPDVSNVYEIDYQYIWKGVELELTYNGEKAVYVPEIIESGKNILLDKAGLAEGDSPVDGIYGISYNPDSGITQIMRGRHEGYIDVPIYFEDDTVTIDDKMYSYASSGDSLTIFAEDGTSAVYSNYTFALESFNTLTTTNFFVNGDEMRGWDTVGWFVENSFQTDLDLTQLIEPYAVTDDFIMNIDDAYITIKANNPYEKSAPLVDCYVCYILINDPELIIQKGDSIIGQTTYDEVDQMYEAAYEKKPDLLRYKTNHKGGVVISDFSLDSSYGQQLLSWDDYEVIYDFKDQVLQDVRIEIPALLYNGLQDNVKNDTLDEMNVATMKGAIETRDDVLSQLKNAFSQAGVSVNIDETTGEIIMDSTVLFDFDSSELTEEGKNYINSFMGVYTNVILDNSLKDIISEVRFEGHTDSEGDYDYNLELSQKRAEAVFNYCLNSEKINLTQEQKECLKSITSTIGYSYSDLVYDSNGEEDADASRRVAIKFYINVE